MQMLAVILDILKIIGILLLCIVIFLLVVLLLLMFYPFSYCVNLKKEEQLTGKIILSWLLHFLALEVVYREGVNVRVKLAGIPVYDKRKQEEKAARKEEKKKQTEKKAEENGKISELKAAEAIGAEEEGHVSGDLEYETLDRDLAAESEKQEDHTEKDGQAGRGRKKKKRTWWEFPVYFFDLLKDWLEKLADWLLELPWKLEDLVDHLEEKMISLSETVEYYSRLFQKKGSKWVYDFLKKELTHLLKHLAPKRSDINIYYANEDPAKVADMMAYYGMALPFLPKHTRFTAELGEARLEGAAKIKGRFFLAVIGWHLIRIYFNKKVRIFLKLMKREAV